MRPVSPKKYTFLKINSTSITTDMKWVLFLRETRLITQEIRHVLQEKKPIGGDFWEIKYHIPVSWTYLAVDISLKWDTCSWKRN